MNTKSLKPPKSGDANPQPVSRGDWVTLTRCSAPACGRAAAFGLYRQEVSVRRNQHDEEQHVGCPVLCEEHARQINGPAVFYDDRGRRETAAQSERVCFALYPLT